ncbi:MAG: ShlB/FhaC/HecB family hemolysin secretion/activation protein [Chromatiales bacterium]|nr:ShlB/FhaC/HecB family hemolysin secretion/activation protein [Chromatiales bacterium]
MSKPGSAMTSRMLSLIRLVPALACVAAPAVRGQDAPGAARPGFDVWEYRVVGNTVLDSLAIERAVYPQLGPGKTIDDVNAARGALEQAYRDAGYPTVFVDVPEQEVDRGLVRLAVTEGRISRLKVTGARYFSNGWIREQLPEATPGTVPRIDAFQAQLRALNVRSADRLLTPVLRPGADQGTVEIEVKVQDALPVNGSLEINNRNTANTTDSRLEAAVRYDNLWQRDHSFGLQYQVAPEDPDETEVIAASYVLRPKASGKVFAFYGLSSDSDIAIVGGDISSIGKGEVYGARAVLPLEGGEGLFHSLVLGVDYKDFDETIGFNQEGDEDIVTPITYLNWSLGWNATLPRETRTHTYDLTANFGIRGLGNDEQEFADKRFKGRPNYFYVEGGYELVQALPWWGTSLAVDLRGQLTPQALISNEQFATGGRDSVRGYYEGELLGDYGLQASVEWRSPNVGPRVWKPLDNLYGYGFFEGARLLLNDPLPDQVDAITVLSAGVGLRLVADPLTAGLDLAVPFKDGLVTGEGDERLLFSLRYGF